MGNDVAFFKIVTVSIAGPLTGGRGGLTSSVALFLQDNIPSIMSTGKNLAELIFKV